MRASVRRLVMVGLRVAASVSVLLDFSREERDTWRQLGKYR